MESPKDTHSHLIVIFLGTIVAFVVGVTLIAAKSVILPFVFAIFAAYTVEPLIRLLRRWHIPRWLGAFAVVGLLFVAIYLTVNVISATVEQLESRLPEHADNLQQLLRGLPLPEGAADFRLDDPVLWEKIREAVDFGSIAGDLTSIFSSIALVLVLTTAIVIGRARFDTRIDDVAAQATGHPSKTAAVIDAIDAGIQRYMLVKTLVSFATGLTFWLVQTLFGSDFAILWGFLAFVMNFVPTFGPVVATIPVVAMLFLQNPDDTGLAAFGAIVTVAIPVVFCNVIEPKLFGDHLNLNFFAIILSLLFWVFIWGVPGAVIAVPVTLTISLICREVDALRPLHDLLRN